MRHRKKREHPSTVYPQYCIQQCERYPPKQSFTQKIKETHPCPEEKKACSTWLHYSNPERYELFLPPETIAFIEPYLNQGIMGKKSVPILSMMPNQEPWFIRWILKFVPKQKQPSGYVSASGYVGTVVFTDVLSDNEARKPQKLLC